MLNDSHAFHFNEDAMQIQQDDMVLVILNSYANFIKPPWIVFSVLPIKRVVAMTELRAFLCLSLQTQSSVEFCT